MNPEDILRIVNKVDRDLARTSERREFVKADPHPKQGLFLALDEDEKLSHQRITEGLFGGATGGGKTIALLMDALKYVGVPNYSALLLRRNFPDLIQEGGLISVAKEWLSNTRAKWNERDKEWLFPSGAKLRFGYLDTENDKYRYQGGEYQYCVGEGTPVLMADGSYKAIEQIKEGDLVRTLEGARRVTKLWEPRYADAVRVQIGSRSQVQSTNHRLLTRSGWTSYDGMVSASRLSAFFSPTQYHCVHKYASPSSMRCPCVQQPLEDRFVHLPPAPGRCQSHLGHRSWSECDVYRRSQYVASAYKLSEDQIQSVQRLLSSPSLEEPETAFRRLLPFAGATHVCGCGDCSAPLLSLSPSYRCGCLGGFHLRGAQPHHVLGSDRGPSLLLVDVAVHSPKDSGLGVRDVIRGRSQELPQYEHPYRVGDIRQSEECVSFEPCVVFPCGVKKLFDLTVEGVSHYITRLGVINQNCGFDELTQFTESQYLYLFSRVRKREDIPVPLRVRGATNPGGVGGQWVYDRFIPEDFSPQEARQLRVWYKTQENGHTTAFVPSMLDDNPSLDREGYIESLANLDEITRQQYLNGDWLIQVRGDILYTYSEAHTVISWSQFESVFGVRHIPDHWIVSVYQDWGMTKDHPCVTSWFATAGENASPVNGVPMAGRVFLYRGLMLTQCTASDVGNLIKGAMTERGEMSRCFRWQMSHEASSERLEYHQKGLLFTNWPTGRTRGIEQLKNAFALTDGDKPNPFKPTLSGTPKLLLIVSDDELVNPKTDAGLARWRAEIPAYHTNQLKSGEVMTRWEPYPLFNDAIDTMRAAAVDYWPPMQELTKQEKFIQNMPEEYKDPQTDDQKVARHLWMQKQFKEQERKAASNRSMGSALDKFAKMRGRF